MDNSTKRVLRIPEDEPFYEVYYTYRLWVFFIERREKKEDIAGMFHQFRDKMMRRITLTKISDTEKFVVLCMVEGHSYLNALCNTDSSVSIMPMMMANQLSFKIKPFDGLEFFLTDWNEDGDKLAIDTQPASVDTLAIPEFQEALTLETASYSQRTDTCHGTR
ncbi:hypothetical protein DY000_02053234 [Brassica cretica]|uniref:Uncharacterized protein n=1 Tax=Brassica cretica TaxID=69181 RepID=A0ABQ7ADX7_BRACR|nr:hypothetical protein DY000_02053234 [Brassica cretica]